MRNLLSGVTSSLLVFLCCPTEPQSTHRFSQNISRPAQAAEERFQFCGEFDLGHGGAYAVALNAEATRLYVVGESSWLDILDIGDPSSIRCLAQGQFDGMPYGEDGKYGIAYDPQFQRVAVGGGSGSKLFLIDVSGDQPRLLDAVFPPRRQFPAAPFPDLPTTPPVFVKHGSAIAAAMKSSGFAVDASSGQTVYFGEGVYLMSIDQATKKMSVADEGIGGSSTVFRQLYDPARDLLWCGGQDGAEAMLDFSGGAVTESRYWSCRSGDWDSRIFPDAITHDGRWLIERVSDRYPGEHWFIRIRQIESADGSYSLWSAQMPTDGASPHLLGSPINWNGDTEDPGSRISSSPLLPSVFTHDDMYLTTAEAGGSELLILDLTDKTTEPHVLFRKNVGDGEKIQSIKGHRNRFYVSLKSGKVVVYEWNFVHKPDPPSGLTAAASPLDQDITLSWLVPFAGVSPAGYNVYRRIASTAFERVASVTDLSWTDFATAEGTTYIYMVRSFAPNYHPVESDDSAEAHATTPTLIPPTKVLGLSAEPTLGGVALRWRSSPEADVVGYFVYRRTASSPFVKITLSPVHVSRHLDVGLTPGQSYSYYVAAVDSNLEGPPSETILATAGSQTGNLLLNPGAEEQSALHWTNAGTTFPPDSANRFSFDNDLFIAVSSSQRAEGQWSFWADQTEGRFDRQTQSLVNDTYFLAAYQDVDISDFCDLIDSPGGGIFADWGGHVLRTTEDDSVTPSIAIECFNADCILLARQELSSGESGRWVVLSSTHGIPPGSRKIRFWMFATNLNTAPANAAWDDLWLVLREEPPHQPLSISIVPSPSGIILSFGPTIAGKSYQAEYTDNLLSGASSWKACGPALPGQGATVQWLDSPNERVNPTYPPSAQVRCRFYRVKEE